MPKIKICGLTTLDNALAVSECNIHAIGLNFYNKSKRRVEPEVARDICNNLPPFISKVGLFVNHSQDEIKQILRMVNLDILQFHGGESPEFCQSFGLDYIKSIGVDVDTDLSAINHYQGAKAILLDSKSDGFGGSGKTFDWSLIKQKINKPVILAGGINQDNVVDAINQVRPYAIDIASGVESAYGIKDITKINNIISKI